MVKTLVRAAEALDKIDEYNSHRTYPVTRSSAIVDYELKLRGDRAKVLRFVQASGTLARVLLEYRRQPVEHEDAREVALEQFDMIRPARREGGQPLDRHEQFGYDFIKTVLLWLDSGVGAVLREFSPESQYAAVGGRRRFPVSRDATADALETQLIPYLMSLATDLPVQYPEYGVPHLDANAYPAVTLFASEKAAVQALGVAMRGVFTDLYDEGTPPSPEEAMNNRPAATFFWGFKVCIAILHQASIDVRFPFVISAFGEAHPGPEIHSKCLSLPIMLTSQGFCQSGLPSPTLPHLAKHPPALRTAMNLQSVQMTRLTTPRTKQRARRIRTPTKAATTGQSQERRRARGSDARTTRAVTPVTATSTLRRTSTSTACRTNTSSAAATAATSSSGTRRRASASTSCRATARSSTSSNVGLPSSLVKLPTVHPIRLAY